MLKRWVFLARLSTKVISNGSAEENGKGSTWTVWKFLQHNTGHSFNLQLHLVRSPLVASITLLQDLILHWSWYSCSYIGLLLLILHVRVWAPISHYGQLVQRTRVLLRHLHDTALAYERYTPTALHNEETVHMLHIVLAGAVGERGDVGELIWSIIRIRATAHLEICGWYNDDDDENLQRWGDKWTLCANCLNK